MRIHERIIGLCILFFCLGTGMCLFCLDEWGRAVVRVARGGAR